MKTVLRNHEDPEQAIWRSDFPLNELPPVFTEIAKTLAGLTLCGWIPTDDDHPRAQGLNLIQVRTRDGVPGLLSRDEPLLQLFTLDKQLSTNPPTKETHK